MHPRPKQRGLLTALIALALAASLTSLAATPPLAYAQPLPPVTRTFDLVVQQLHLLNPPVKAESDSTVGTSPVQVKVADGSRVELIISNTGTTNCTVSHSNQVTTAKGFLLVSSGGSLTENYLQDLDLMTQEVWAVCAAAGGTLHIATLTLH